MRERKGGGKGVRQKQGSYEKALFHFGKADEKRARKNEKEKKTNNSLAAGGDGREEREKK